MIPFHVSSSRGTSQSKFVSTDRRGFLTEVNVLPEKPCYRPPQLKFGLVNARSLKMKPPLITDNILDTKCDIVAFTETWLSPGTSD